MRRVTVNLRKIVPWQGNPNGPLTKPLSLNDDLRILQAGTPRMRKSVLLKADNAVLSDDHGPVMGRTDIARKLISERIPTHVFMPDQWRSRVLAYLQLIADIFNLLITPFCRKSPSSVPVGLTRLLSLYCQMNAISSLPHASFI
jgi:hypothetical protein